VERFAVTDVNEPTTPAGVEAAIREKAKNWVKEYGKDFLIELIDVYLDDVPKRLAELRRALETSDLDAFTRQAHTLKSSSAEVGAAGLSAMAKEMESLGRAGRLEGMAKKLSEMEEAYEHVQAALRSVRTADWGAVSV
jgi:HPt (histidine-containing phosphotransfer) domain-containing protein